MEVNAALNSSLANGLIACASAWQDRREGSGDSLIRCRAKRRFHSFQSSLVESVVACRQRPCSAVVSQ